MENLFEQIEIGIRNDLYYLSFYVALTIPDICGALDSDNGIATSDKYKNWFNRLVAHKYNGFVSGEDCYYLRCSLLHQGTTQHPRNKYSRILFVEPSATTNILHNNILDDALNIDVRIFCRDMVDSAKNWLQTAKNTHNYKTNIKKFITRYPNGLAPYIVGVPVIS